MNTVGIRKGDMVKVLSGREKGKTGKILEVFPKANRVSIEGLNIRVRFSRPKRQGEKGQRLELPAPMDISKLMLICSHCGKPTRLGKLCKHCGKDLR